MTGLLTIEIFDARPDTTIYSKGKADIDVMKIISMQNYFMGEKDTGYCLINVDRHLFLTTQDNRLKVLQLLGSLNE